MEKIKFQIYDGDVEVSVDITEEKKNLIVERILQYCKDENCISGETLHQNDNCIINAPVVLSDIIDNILKFETRYED